MQAEPQEREAAGIAFAFDAESAAELVEQVPADLDFGESALVCVYLGERPTTGWGLTLQSATLVPGEPPELRILARETRPRADARQEVTYPADCAALTRAALP
ncbi:MAG TPA: protease complex subunit PrcB family protein, partial [Candidatus Limnocylindria bacterium]|nr:protease complex subunit PrcB family protein [Candidatus Limnocylindria bacterium]